ACARTNVTCSLTNSYTVDANPFLVGRTGVVMFAGQPFTVRQDPLVCSYGISPDDRDHGFGTGSGVVSLTTSSNCAGTLQNTNNWIHFSTTNGTGSLTNSYTVDANPFLVGRTGVVMFAGQPFTVRQDALVCSYGILPDHRDHGF